MPIINGGKRASISQRKASAKFESRKGDRQYDKLLDGSGASSVGASGGRKRIFANGALVSSNLNTTAPNEGTLAPDVKHEKWWHCTSLLHLVFEYVGVHQLYLGQVEDDQQRLFHHEHSEVRCTALVCKQWSMSARTMDVVDFRPLRYTMTDCTLHKALQLMRFGKQLFLAECRRVKFQQPSFGMVGKNLLVLNLVGCSNLTDSSLCAMTLEMPKLKELYVPACQKLEKVAISLPMEGSQLEVLDISANLKVTDDAIERLITDHPKLRELFLSQMDKLCRPQIRSKTLELINLDGCEGLTFSVAIAIMKSCPNLKYVTLGENDRMLEEGVKAFCPLINLLELNISATFQDDHTINTALAHLPNLRLLDCGNSEYVVRPEFKHPTLEILVVNLCCELEDGVFTNLEEKLPSLKHLSCNHCDSLVRPTVRHSKLELLDFSNCVHICSDKKVREWVTCPALRMLYLGHTQHVTDAEIVLISKTNPAIEELNLYQASSLHKPDLSQFKAVCAANLAFVVNLSLIFFFLFLIPVTVAEANALSSMNGDVFALSTSFF